MIEKIRFCDRFCGELNPRQEKAIGRMSREEDNGFEGGPSAENSISVTMKARATATRDLRDLFAKGALVRTGVRRDTRYRLSPSATGG
jgi:Fic family protein